MYNFNHLYYFYITAKSGSVMTAAKHLHISQPSLSSQIKVLEDSLNLKLFHKVGRTNELTRNGKLVFWYCKKMFNHSEELSEILLQKFPTETRNIQIGVSDEVDRPIIVEVISHFLKNQPLVHRPKVTIIAGDQMQLVEKLRLREIDVMVSELKMTDPDLVNLAQIEVPVVLLCSSKFKMKSNLKNLSPSAAIKEIIGGNVAQWVMPSSKFKLRFETDKFFESNRLKGRVVFESDVIASLVHAVTDEIGLTFLPLLYVGRELSENSIRALGPKDGYWKYRIWLATNKQNKKDELIDSISRSFSEVCEVNYYRLAKKISQKF